MVDFEEDITACVDYIRKGGVILYPTDTVWGLGCSALNEAAIDKIFAIKQRPKEKSLIVLLATAKDVLQFVAAPPPDIIAIIESFETPTTIIYEGALGLADNAIHENGSIAIRVTQDPFCKALIKRLQAPIISTSANISGAPTPAIYPQIAPEILSKVDYIVKYRREDNTLNQPSQIVRVNDEGVVTRIR